MPVYEYRCQTCGSVSAFTYKSVSDYDTARESLVCAACSSDALTRVISRVAISKPGRDYAKMSSDEMLSVFEGGDAREVGRMIHEVGGDAALNDPHMAHAARRLMDGDSPAKVEKDLTESE
jgi:putative FmdB family regulatory protein